MFIHFKYNRVEDCFPIRTRISYALRVLGWNLGNWDPFKGTRRLSRVDLFESGRDNFIGIRAPIF